MSSGNLTDSIKAVRNSIMTKMNYYQKAGDIKMKPPAA